MPGLAKKRLTVQVSVRYSCGSGVRDRAMSTAYRDFAFTYRFLFRGKRAGETRAGELSS